MKLKCHPAKTKWQAPKFTLSQISRDDLTLILTYARDAMAAEVDERKAKDMPRNSTCEQLLEIVRRLDDYVNAEDRVVWLEPIYVG